MGHQWNTKMKKSNPPNPNPTRVAEADWYFDFISPFAYLQHELLLRRRPPLKRNYRPVLLVGLLRHWGTKGPAEIPAKRAVSYQHCQWLAGKYDIPMKFPPAHPFNPLSALRLAIAQHCQETCVTDIFRALYADGADLAHPPDWEKLCRQRGAADGASLVSQPWVKEQLRANTEAAVRQGVFGVPTLMIGGRQFWGADMTDMALDYSAHPDTFERGEYRRLADLPVGRTRKI